jgi:hypothetical protein
VAQDAYWRIFAEEVPSDLGLSLSAGQVDDLTNALIGAHENYGVCSGSDVADANWRANHDRQMQQAGAAKVLAYIEERMATIDGVAPRVFEAMSTRQRLAMHELFQARSLLRKSGVPV